MSRDVVSWMRSSAPMYFESDLGSNMIQICIATLAWTFNWMGLSLPLDSELHSFQKKLLEEAWIQTNASTFGCDPHTRSTCYCRVFMIIHYPPIRPCLSTLSWRASSTSWISFSLLSKSRRQRVPPTEAFDQNVPSLSEARNAAELTALETLSRA